MMNNMDETKIMVGWTTVRSKEDALELIEKLVQLDLIACGQINGPLESFYKWDGETTKDIEWRITMKYAKRKEANLFEKIKDLHPYDVPQWVSLVANTSEEYGDWVNRV
ncbi:MAG: divalent-cation tolerance protein CutA [Opitutae bacterium]